MTDHDTEHHAGGPAEWDERYSASNRIWSGAPNGTLITETAQEIPGRALDVGCGEGADAVWLARHGWQVTGLDVSAVALSRAREAAKDAGVEIEWVHGGLVDAGLSAGAFDLVTAHYPALPKTPGHNTERTLLGLVAPGGTLLVVFHADFDTQHLKDRGIDPEDYVWMSHAVAALDDKWTIEVNERRPRQIPAGGDARHTADLVLRARRASPDGERN
ncbi:MAG TPA: class I SAM-dependent methyltransferase [Acidimicrobiales bacterium]|jgi:SAM-dependent methyltransferase|nr:class I SAM-dependent methyltransferase [Acidimicrobiales bacterium]